MIRSALHETSAGFSARSSPNASQLFSLLAQPFSPDPFWPADKCIRWTRKLVDIPWCVRTLTPPFGSRRFSREPEGSAVKKEEEAGLYVAQPPERASPRARCISTDFNLHTRVGSRPRGMLLVSPRSNIIVERFRVNSSRERSLFLLSSLYFLISAVKFTARNTDNIIGVTFYTFGRHMTRPASFGFLLFYVNLLIVEIV